jgi:hypothetical protein
MATQPKNEELSEQTHLIRAVAASLKIDVPDQKEINFRACLLLKTAAELPRLKAAFVIRLYEAACEVRFPSEEVTHFRHACQPALASIHGLEAYKSQLPKPPARRAS